jgi:D-sedoheptulose 7-phosphate isomerase
MSGAHSVQSRECGQTERTVLVSVVIPTRGRPNLVVKAVKSTLRQDLSSLEVIVVIDGDDAETRAALNVLEDARLRVIDLAVSVGGAEARNMGVRSAKGKWIAFLDDDDEWLQHKLSRQIVAARRSRAAWPVVASRLIVRTPEYEAVRPLREYRAGQPVSEYLFCRRSLRDGPYAMQTSTLMVPRELMVAVPFRGGLQRHQDWDWVLRAERALGVEFVVVNEPLVVYRTEDGRASVGHGQDWAFSLAWGREMLNHLSARAYAWFVAAECASRAAKSRAGLAVYAEIVREFALKGRPAVGSALLLMGFLGLPRTWREGAQRISRRWRQRELRGMPAIVRSEVQKMNELGCQVQNMDYIRRYMDEVREIAARVDSRAIERMVELLCDTRLREGRVFFLGVGGGAGHASHAVNDFRKIAGIECYTPSDNVSELTARINDDGWESCYANWLRGSRLGAGDMVFVFSVGGGDASRGVSANLVESLKLAREAGARIAGIVGRDGGYTAQVADACVIIPTVSDDTVTAHAESFQAVIWHLLVSHPRLRRNEMKWEQVQYAGTERSFSIATA